MAATKRTAFFVSDRTGITAETLGNSLLTQFETMEFKRISLRFVDNIDRAQQVNQRIRQAFEADGERPLVFSTLVDPTVRDTLNTENCIFFDFFGTFIAPLEQELKTKSNHTAGRTHGLRDIYEYSARIEAINFTLNHDDGSNISKLEEADIIVIGISRTGKTPTCLYLSLHYGIRAANFPLTEDDLEELRLPESIRSYRGKLFGLTIDAERLQQIRQERFPNSRYASMEQCEYETRQAEALYRKLRIPHLVITLKSIEEIATSVIDLAGLEHFKSSREQPKRPIHT